MTDDLDIYFNAKTKKTTITSTVYRIVESDLHIATLKITESLEDQARLEEMIDSVKPKPDNPFKHYLLTTPFRYPPLKYGSRYGTRMMNSFFYGSQHLETCLVECAYYRLVFLNDITVPFDQPLNNNFLLFSVSVSSPKSLDLTTPKWSEIHGQLTDPQDYSLTQKIGHWAVNEADIKLIKFPSARHKQGTNYAIADIKCIKSRKPKMHARLACISTNQQVIFQYQEQLIKIPNTVMHQAISLDV